MASPASSRFIRTSMRRVSMVVLDAVATSAASISSAAARSVSRAAMHALASSST